MMKKIGLVFIALLLTVQPIFGAAYPVRLKDIGKIIEARDNQLVGFGLVVGLKNTGDSRSSAFTDIALSNMLGKLGVSSNGQDFNSRNVAAVMVTATLPPFIKQGQRISVVVSSVGDSTSLNGGTLLLTPLQGPDLNTYAVAQGAVVVGGIYETAGDNTRFSKNTTTVGRIPDGAIVEDEVPVTFTDQHNITIVLNDTNFITAARAVEAIKSFNFPGARAIDANTIKVPLSDLKSMDLVTAIATLEEIPVVPDSSSKVIINSRTGTVIIGEMVRLFPVAITHGNISVRVNDQGLGGGAVDQPPLVVSEEGADQIIYLNPSASLNSLVNALNEIGASPKDLISVLQALKQSGSLVGTLEII